MPRHEDIVFPHFKCCKAIKQTIARVIFMPCAKKVFSVEIYVFFLSNPRSLMRYVDNAFKINFSHSMA